MVVCGPFLLFALFEFAVGDDRSLSNTSTYFLPEITEDEACVPGVLYKLQCNTCRCSEGRTLMCTKMACIDWKKHNKSSDEKKVLRDSSEIKPKAYQHLPRVLSKPCVPGRMFRIKCRMCFCTEDKILLCSKKQKEGCIFDLHGNPPPIRTPEDLVPSLPPADLAGILTLSSTSEKCKPGVTYVVDCNYCICMENGNLLCQNKYCLSDEDIEKIDAKLISGKPCKAGKTITENCKRCDCVNGKTSCRVIRNCSKRLQLAGGSAEPHHLDLKSHQDKCIPHFVYKSDCNKCFCQADGSLRCTLKTCLRYSQVQLLEKQREYLEKHGL